MDIRAWLRDLGLEVYADAFEANAIDRALLPELTAQDLKDLGVAALGHRKRLLSAVGQLVEDAAAPASPEAGRRQVTVLFIDLCGYTALSNRLDPEDLHALLNRYFDLVDGTVAEFGGRIDKHMGDAVMAVFGAPVAHANDPERAVRAAWEVRERLSSLRLADGPASLDLHAGIAVGEVLASGTGSRHHLEYTVTGDSVNLASRLQALAGAGDILLSGDVYRAARAVVDAEERKLASIPGFDGPVSVWRLADVHADRRNAWRYGFVGRQAELRQFDAILQSAAGGTGGALVVRGEAGIGKSRFALECAQRAEAEGFRVHTSQVLDFGAEIGRDAVRTLVRRLLDLDPGAEETVRAEAAVSATRDLELDAVQSATLHDLLNLPLHGRSKSSYETQDAEGRNEAKRALVERIVRTRAERHPLMLIVEDIHWADELALSQFARLTTIASEGPVVLMLTTRIEGDPCGPAWRVRLGPASLATFDLSPLQGRDAVQLANEISRGDTAAVAAWVARAGGNPLFLEQLVLSAHQNGTNGVPGSLQSLIQARIDALGRCDRRAAQAASVLGQRFAAGALRELLDAPAYACDGLVEAYLVRAEDGGYSFAHALIRDGVYASMPKRDRTTLHLRAAKWFEGRDKALWARHLALAEAEWAALAYLEAAQQAAEQYRFEAALSLAEQGLGVSRSANDRSRLAVTRGDLLIHVGRVSDALASYDDALASAPDAGERARALVGRVRGMRIAEQIDGAFDLLDEAQGIAEGGDLEDGGLMETLIELHHLRGNLCFPLGRSRQCETEHRRALDLARQIGSSAWEAKALGGLGDAAYAMGRMRSAHENFAGCVALCRELGLGATEVANASMISHTQLYLLDLAGSVESCRTTVELARDVGHWRAELNALASAMWAAREMQDLDAAREFNEGARYIVEHRGARRYLPEILCMDAELHLAERNRAAGIDVLHHALAVQREAGLAFFGPVTLGLIALHTDDPAERHAALREAEDLLALGSLGHNFLQFYRDAIVGAVAHGEWSEVYRYAAALEAYTRDEPLPWSTFFCRWGRAMAQGENGSGLSKVKDELVGLHACAEAARLTAYQDQLAVILGCGSVLGSYQDNPNRST